MMFTTVAITAFAALAAAAPVKRGFGGEATYYATGLGACGEVSHDSDFIVALNSPQFGSGYPGPNCFKQVQISANGKTATATIMDQCPGCAHGDLDMSPALFNHFADPAVGRFAISWEWAGSAPAPAPEPTYEAPKTSSTPEPAPTSTYVAPSSTWVAPTTSETPSSTWVAPSSSSTPEVKESASSAAPSSSVAPSSSSAPAQSSSSVQASPVASSSASSESASTSAVSTSATTTASAPIPTITVDFGNGNLAELCEAVAQMGKLVVVGASLADGTAVTLGNTTLTIE